MAAKSAKKASVKKAKGVKTSKTSKSSAKYTSAQYQAYQTASKNAIKAAQLQHNSKVLQERRLQGAAKAVGKARAKRAEVIKARIKKNAVSATYRQTAYAKQSKVLRVQAAHNLFKAQQLATNRQFAALGEAIHARTTVLQTLTNAQALNSERMLSKAAQARVNKKPRKATGATRKSSTSRSKIRKPSYKAVGQAAGRAAAARTPRNAVAKTRKAAGGMEVFEGEHTWLAYGNDEDVENCVAVAIANHLLLYTGHKVTNNEVTLLAARCGVDTIPGALDKLDQYNLWGYKADLSEYGMIDPRKAEPGMVVGFKTKQGDHCGVLMPGHMVVSWGEVIPLEWEIDECWEIVWTKKTS